MILTQFLTEIVSQAKMLLAVFFASLAREKKNFLAQNLHLYGISSEALSTIAVA